MVGREDANRSRLGIPSVIQGAKRIFADNFKSKRALPQKVSPGPHVQTPANTEGVSNSMANVKSPKGKGKGQPAGSIPPKVVTDSPGNVKMPRGSRKQEPTQNTSPKGVSNSMTNVKSPKGKGKGQPAGSIPPKEIYEESEDIMTSPKQKKSLVEYVEELTEETEKKVNLVERVQTLLQKIGLLVVGVVTTANVCKEKLMQMYDIGREMTKGTEEKIAEPEGPEKVSDKKLESEIAEKKADSSSEIQEEPTIVPAEDSSEWWTSIKSTLFGE